MKPFGEDQSMSGEIHCRKHSERGGHLVDEASSHASCHGWLLVYLLQWMR